MITIRYASAMLAVLFWVVVAVRWNMDGWAVLATLMVVVWFWTFGVFSAAFWMADPATDARLSAVDESLDFEASVLGDLTHLDDENGR